MADSDDWRVTIPVTSQTQAGQAQAGPAQAGPAQAGQAQQPVSLRQAEDDIRRQVGRGIAVGAGEAQIFLYADTEAAARDAERIARDVLAAHGIAATEGALHRWHPIEEQWEDPGVPMPQNAAEREAEHRRLTDAETAESLATGSAQWEVRVELSSHRQAVHLAHTLEHEGRAVLRRWKFLIVGASNEDEARELAGQIRQEAPPGAAVIVEQAGVGWPFPPS